MTASDTSTTAIMADLHGNLVALDAVLADIGRLGIRRLVIAGDIAWGPQPAETVGRIMALDLDLTIIRGNADREVADPSTVAGDPFLRQATEWCTRQLTDDQRRWLDDLPLSATIRVAGMGDVLVCHGSPRSDVEGMRPDTDPRQIGTWLAGIVEPTVVCGHTHVQFERTVGDHRIINPGSVGLHYGVRGAQWALLGPELEFQTTTYDNVAAAGMTRDSGIPGAAEFARFLLDPTRPT